MRNLYIVFDKAKIVFSKYKFTAVFFICGNLHIIYVVGANVNHLYNVYFTCVMLINDVESMSVTFILLFIVDNIRNAKGNELVLDNSHFDVNGYLFIAFSYAYESSVNCYMHINNISRLIQTPEHSSRVFPNCGKSGGQQQLLRS